MSMPENAWIAVALDGVLAEDRPPDGSIGKPIPAMIERVKRWLRAGKDVRILTPRVWPLDVLVPGYVPTTQASRQKKLIQEWCKEHVGQELPVTCTIDPRMTEYWGKLEKIPLPDERRGVTLRFQMGHGEGELKGYCTLNAHEERPVELFLKLSKVGSVAHGLADTLARVISVALRYGIPIEEIKKQLEGQAFDPQGMVEGQKGFYKSCLDYIAAWLGKEPWKKVEEVEEGEEKKDEDRGEENKDADDEGVR